MYGPDYEEAKARLNHAAYDGLAVLQAAGRQPRANMPDQPTIARINTPNANRVLTEVRYARYDAPVRYAGDDRGLASYVRQALEGSIPRLEDDVPKASAAAAVRLRATIDAFRKALDAIVRADADIDAARKAHQASEQERYPKNDERDSALRLRSMLLADLFDAADNAGVKYDWRVLADQFSYVALSTLASQAALKAPEAVRSSLEEASAALDDRKPRKAWLALSAVATNWPAASDPKHRLEVVK